MFAYLINYSDFKDITSDSQLNSYFPYRWSPVSLAFNIYLYLFLHLYTVDSRYLEIEGTLKNSSRYPYFDISDL